MITYFFVVTVVNYNFEMMQIKISCTEQMCGARGDGATRKMSDIARQYKEMQPRRPTLVLLELFPTTRFGTDWMAFWL